MPRKSGSAGVAMAERSTTETVEHRIQQALRSLQPYSSASVDVGGCRIGLHRDNPKRVIVQVSRPSHEAKILYLHGDDPLECDLGEVMRAAIY
jgi:hypothetical protein